LKLLFVFEFLIYHLITKWLLPATTIQLAMRFGSVVSWLCAQLTIHSHYLHCRRDKLWQQWLEILLKWMI